LYGAEGENALEGKFNKNNYMAEIKIFTLADWIGTIVQHVNSGYAFYYDIREMQNVASDDVSFPAVFMEEYYGLRMIDHYGWQREYTIELHWLNLCEMQNDSRERDEIREELIPDATAFVNELKSKVGLITEYTLDPEPPMFDANAVGMLMRVTFRLPQCMTFTNPYPLQ